MPAFLSILSAQWHRNIGRFFSLRSFSGQQGLELLLGGNNSYAASLHWLYSLTGD